MYQFVYHERRITSRLSFRLVIQPLPFYQENFFINYNINPWRILKKVDILPIFWHTSKNRIPPLSITTARCKTLGLAPAHYNGSSAPRHIL